MVCTILYYFWELFAICFSLPNCFLFLFSYETTCSHASGWEGNMKKARNEGRYQEMRRPLSVPAFSLHLYITLSHSLSFSLAGWPNDLDFFLKLLLLLFNKIYVTFHSFLSTNIINMFEFVVIINDKYWADKKWIWFEQLCRIEWYVKF